MGYLYKQPNIEEDEFLMRLFEMARDMFENGIYIGTNNHKCGWDFLSFGELDSWDELKTTGIGYGFYDLNDKMYESCEEHGQKLIDVLKANDWKWEFERKNIKWC